MRRTVATAKAEGVWMGNAAMPCSSRIMGTRFIMSAFPRKGVNSPVSRFCKNITLGEEAFLMGVVPCLAL